jgi:DNA-binding response OmpR family regulator
MYKIFSNKSILIAEDDLVSNENLSYMLKKIFKEVISCFNGDEAYESYLTCKPDIIFTDIEMPSMNGLNLVKKIRQRDICTPIVIMTSFTHQDYLMQAVNLQLLSYIVKPITKTNFQTLLQTVQKHFELTTPELFYFSATSYYDYLNKIIINDLVKLALTNKEIVLLEEFIKNKNITLQAQFLEDILGYGNADNSNALKLVLTRLRKKLPNECIKTVYGQGYRLEH